MIGFNNFKEKAISVVEVPMIFNNGIGSMIEVCIFYQNDMQHHDVLLEFDNLQKLGPINIDYNKKGLRLMNSFQFPILNQYRSVIPSEAQVKQKNLEWINKHVNMSKSNLDEIIKKIKLDCCNDNPLDFKNRK